MKQCKPCITIRDTIKIIWFNIKKLPQNIRCDMKSHANINSTVCILDKPSAYDGCFDPAVQTMKKIRTLAKENYAPHFEKLDGPEAESDFSVCEKVRQLGNLK